MRRVLVILIICWFLLFLFAVYVHINKEKEFKLAFLDIGQGDSTLIQFKDGSEMLVDCGQNKKVLAKLGKYLPFYDRTIEYLMISHYDLDHYGGCIDVLRRYKVKHIIHNGSSKEDKYFQEWDRYRELEKANEIVITTKSELKIASSTLIFLSPTELTKDENGNSVVFKLINSNNTVLFTGDIDEKKEEQLINKYCNTSSERCGMLEADILKVSHHGSGGSSSEDFLTIVDPEMAVISVGKNSFGHPSLRVIKRLERENIHILQTNMIHDIVISN